MSTTSKNASFVYELGEYARNHEHDPYYKGDVLKWRISEPTTPCVGIFWNPTRGCLEEVCAQRELPLSIPCRPISSAFHDMGISSQHHVPVLSSISGQGYTNDSAYKIERRELSLSDALPGNILPFLCSHLLIFRIRPQGFSTQSRCHLTILDIIKGTYHENPAEGRYVWVKGASTDYDQVSTVVSDTIISLLGDNPESVHKFLEAARQQHSLGVEFPRTEENLLSDLAAAQRTLKEVEEMVRGSVDSAETDRDDTENNDPDVTKVAED
ncbi:hypothetical protein B0H14DRAFT_2615333 [Mycena olivaceomarginata]|nr:hypothetical protein B0H14DRAFT_2615333 [Mycena olivaceomarginata]